MWRKERVAAGAKVTRGLDCTPQGGQVAGERLDQGVGVSAPRTLRAKDSRAPRGSGATHWWNAGLADGQFTAITSLALLGNHSPQSAAETHRSRGEIPSSSRSSRVSAGDATKQLTSILLRD